MRAFQDSCRELIEKNLCNADCCGIIPFKKEWWEKHKDKAKADKIEEVGDSVFAIKENLQCAFLEDKRCIVYEDRLEVCRIYGTIEKLPCPYIKPNGNKRTPAITKRILRKLTRDFKEFEKKFKD